MMKTKEVLKAYGEPTLIIKDRNFNKLIVIKKVVIVMIIITSSPLST